jgi:hypothetical protein
MHLIRLVAVSHSLVRKQKEDVKDRRVLFLLLSLYMKIILVQSNITELLNPHSESNYSNDSQLAINTFNMLRLVA